MPVNRYAGNLERYAIITIVTGPEHPLQFERLCIYRGCNYRGSTVSFLVQVLIAYKDQFLPEFYIPGYSFQYNKSTPEKESPTGISYTAEW